MRVENDSWVMEDLKKKETKGKDLISDLVDVLHNVCLEHGHFFTIESIIFEHIRGCFHRTGFSRRLFRRLLLGFLALLLCRHFLASSRTFKRPFEDEDFVGVGTNSRSN